MMDEAGGGSIEVFEELVELLGEQDPDVRAGKMFGMPTIMCGRKAIAGLTHGEMVFKLAGPEHADALGLAGSHLFDPGDMGRPMKQWVVVPTRHVERYEELARAALRDLKGA
jgi:hypothetical protein